MTNKPFYYPGVEKMYLLQRDGSDENPFLPLTQTSKVKYARVDLAEIPNFENKVSVVSLDGTPLIEVFTTDYGENEFLVDYSKGFIRFHHSQENNTFEISYLGIGRVNIPANRITIDTDESNEAELSVQELLDAQGNIGERLTNAQNGIDEVENLITQNQVVKNTVYQSDMNNVNSQISSKVNNNDFNVFKDATTSQLATETKKRGVVAEDEEAIKTAISLANSNQTQLILTADHEVKLDISDMEAVKPTEIIGTGKVEYKKTLLLKKDFNIGVPHNIDEKVFSGTLIEDGELFDSPLAVPSPTKAVNILAHWYNDFGLKKTALAGGESGWVGWYDYQWNHTTNSNYDPKRHPLLGWYRGDDPKALDWICYWLVKYGCTGTILTESRGFDKTTWNNPSSTSYWVYQLLNHVKNFKSLKYVLSVAHSNGMTQAQIETQNDQVVETYDDFPHCFTYNENGKRYAAVFCWDLESLRGTIDNYNGLSNTKTYLKNFAAKMQNIGYDGVYFMARNYSSLWDSVLDELVEAGVILDNAGYETRYGNDTTVYQNQYSNYANSCVFPTSSNQVINVVTSAKTQSPHSSNWNLPGSTPDLFKNLMDRAVKHVLKHNLRKIITVYNVSEWAEGGAGLIPNQQDLFGYLEAIENVPNIETEHIDLDFIKETTKKETIAEIYSNNPERETVIKFDDVSLNGGTNGTRNILTSPYLGDYGFTGTENVNDYLVTATLLVPSYNVDYKLSIYPTLNFASRRLYLTVVNDSGANVTGIKVRAIIRKIN